MAAPESCFSSHLQKASARAHQPPPVPPAAMPSGRVSLRELQDLVPGHVRGRGRNDKEDQSAENRWNQLVGIDINIDGTRCHRVIYVLDQARVIVSCEGRNLPILITS